MSCEKCSSEVERLKKEVKRWQATYFDKDTDYVRMADKYTNLCNEDRNYEAKIKALRALLDRCLFYVKFYKSECKRLGDKCTECENILDDYEKLMGKKG